MFSKSYRFFIFSILIVMLAAGCNRGNNTVAVDSPSADTPKPKAEPLRPGSAIVVNGRLAPAKHADLTFATSGRVTEITVQEGQEVNEGDVLARLSGSEQIRAELAQAEAEKVQAQNDLDGLNDFLAVAQTDAHKKLYDAKQEEYDAQRELGYQANESQSFQKQQASLRLEIARARVAEAQQEYDKLQAGPDPKKLAEAQARLDSANAQIESANAALESLVLEAPFSGTVVKLNMIAGQQVMGGEPAVVLADLSKWVVETDDLTEIKVVRINVGQPLSVTADALPDSVMQGTVEYIPNVYEEKRGDITYTARIAISEVDPRVRWGMTVVVNFQ